MSVCIPDSVSISKDPAMRPSCLITAMRQYSGRNCYAGLASFESSTLATTSAQRLVSSEKLAIAVLLARHGEAVEPDLLKCLPNREYKQTSSGALLEMLSQYRERNLASPGCEGSGRVVARATATVRGCEHTRAVVAKGHTRAVVAKDQGQRRPDAHRGPRGAVNNTNTVNWVLCSS